MIWIRVQNYTTQTHTVIVQHVGLGVRNLATHGQIPTPVPNSSTLGSSKGVGSTSDDSVNDVSNGVSTASCILAVFAARSAASLTDGGTPLTVPLPPPADTGGSGSSPSALLSLRCVLNGLWYLGIGVDTFVLRVGMAFPVYAPVKKSTCHPHTRRKVQTKRTHEGSSPDHSLSGGPCRRQGRWTCPRRSRQSPLGARARTSRAPPMAHRVQLRRPTGSVARLHTDLHARAAALKLAAHRVPHTTHRRTRPREGARKGRRAWLGGAATPLCRRRGKK